MRKDLIFRCHIIDDRSIGKHFFDGDGNNIIVINFAFTQRIYPAIGSLTEYHSFLLGEFLLVAFAITGGLLLNFMQTIGDFLRGGNEGFITRFFI